MGGLFEQDRPVLQSRGRRSDRGPKLTEAAAAPRREFAAGTSTKQSEATVRSLGVISQCEVWVRYRSAMPG